MTEAADTLFSLTSGRGEEEDAVTRTGLGGSTSWYFMFWYLGRREAEAVAVGVGGWLVTSEAGTSCRFRVGTGGDSSDSGEFGRLLIPPSPPLLMLQTTISCSFDASFVEKT